MATLHCLSPKNKIGSKPSPLAMASKHLHFRLQHYGSPKKFTPGDGQSNGLAQHDLQVQSSKLLPEQAKPHNNGQHYHRLVFHKDISHPMHHNLRIHLMKKVTNSHVPKVNSIDYPPSSPHNSKNTSKDRSSKQSSIDRVLSLQRRSNLLHLPNSKSHQSKGTLSHKQLPTHDTSFEQPLSKLIENEAKLALPPKIWSETLLGPPLKKHSTSKLKILVKNPFERHLRHQQSQMQQIKQTEFQTTPEDPIPHIAQNFASSTSRDELSQLVSMI